MSEFDVAFYMPAVTGLLSHGPAPPAGGAETQVYLLARELARRGSRVALVCYRTGEPLPDEIDGVRVIGRPPPQGDRRGVGLLLEAAIALRAALSVDADVLVQRVAGFTTAFVALGARLGRRAFVYSSAAASDFDPERHPLPPRDHWLYRRGLRLAGAIVVQTDEQATLCRRALAREPVVIRSIAEAAPARAARPEAFLWIGRADAFKRPLDYVALAAALPQASFRMVLLRHGAGSAEIAPRVEQAARGLANLELLEALPRAELGALMARTVAIVNTSVYEGMPNVLLEGWARGVPALVLHHDPDGVVEREGLGACAGGSAARLAELARSLWTARDEQQELSERCRDYVRRNHSAAVVAQQWLATLARQRPDGARSGGESAAIVDAAPAGWLSKGD